MPYANFDFVGSFDEDYSTAIDPQNTINMYEISNPQSPKQKALISFPGSRLNVLLPIEGTATARGSFRFLDKNYYVFGQFIYEFSSDISGTSNSLSYTLIGTLNTSVGHVDIEANLTQLIFVDGSNGWIWNGSIFSQITDSNFPANPLSVTYLDGRFFVSSNNTNQFSSSAQEDGLTWPPLETDELTTKGDTIAGLRMLNRRVYVFGKIITEEWYDAGSPGFPLARDNNVSYGFGLASLGSAVSNESVLIWVSLTKQGSSYVMLSDGGQAQKISTTAIDLKLQDYSKISVNGVNGLQDMNASIMEINGQQFYILNSTVANATLVYNITSGKWTFNTMIDDSRYFGQYHTYFNNRHYMGHYAMPALYEVSRDYFTNDGEPMKYTRISKISRTDNGFQTEVKMFEPQLDQGNYVLTPPADDSLFYDNEGAIFTDNQSVAFWDNTHNLYQETYSDDPMAYLSISWDGGHTFGNELTMPLGKIGEFNTRCIWNNLGIGDSFIIKMVVYSAIPLIILGANINYEISSKF